MEQITEIIPDDIPKWARDAMDKGQLWNAVFSRLSRLETAMAPFTQIPKGDDDLKLFVRPFEDPVATFKGSDLRISYGKYWVDFRDGIVRITTEKPFDPDLCCADKPNSIEG